MKKIDYTKNRWKKAKDAISVMCPKCKTVQDLHDLSGWSFIILKRTICENEDCKAEITHDDIIEDKNEIMKCPLCGIKHSKSSTIESCKTIVDNEYTICIIGALAGHRPFTKKELEIKRKYEIMKRYYDLFESVENILTINL